MVSDFATHKQRILKLTKGSIINLQVAKDKAGLKMIASVADCEAVLRVLEKSRKIAPPVPVHVKQRYNDAHKLWFPTEYPAAWTAGHYSAPVFPPIHKSGGLARFIVNWLTWTGNYGNRINTTGRQLPSGKWIKGTTKTGTGDAVACIAGKMHWFEIKIGKDTPSDKQLLQQRRVRASGGGYHFVHSAEEFLNIFDGVVYG